MASNDQKDNDNQGGCSSGVKKNGDHRNRKVRPEQNTSRSSSDGATSSELTQLWMRRTGPGEDSSDKNLFAVPRELKLLVGTAAREQQQQENIKLTAQRIARSRHYTRAEERRRGVSTRLELYSDPWKIKKRLTPSDLGNLSRIQIQTNQVETHVKPSMVRAGLFHQVLTLRGLRVPVWDVDTDTVHGLVLKQWQTTKSFVFVGRWNREFVRRRKLKEDDEVGFMWDPYTSRFFFKLLSWTPNPNP